MRIYVGNLSYAVTDESLTAAFTEFGQVTSAQVITDRDTGRSRGFGFVEMPSADEGRKAITGLAGRDLQGRAITVNEAKPRQEGGGGGQRRYSDGGGGGSGGRGGGGGGGRW